MQEPPDHRRDLRTRDQFFLSCFWFAYNFQWGALLAIVLPSQITAIVGDQHKELFNGLIPPLGAALSLVVTPLAGAISDRSASRFGRRRPFMLVGTLVNLAFLPRDGGVHAWRQYLALPALLSRRAAREQLVGRPLRGAAFPTSRHRDSEARRAAGWRLMTALRHAGRSRHRRAARAR